METTHPTAARSRWARGVVAALAAVGLVAGPAAPAQAAAPVPASVPARPAASPASTALGQTQRNLAALGYLPASRATGRSNSATTAALRAVQRDRCLDAVGVAGPRTTTQLASQVSAVQRALGLRPTGQASPALATRLAAWQRGHHLRADGVAGAATMRALHVARTRACGQAVVGNLRSASTGVPCAPGTRNLGTAVGWQQGRRVAVRLCAIPGFRSSSSESTPGTRFYVRGANHDVVVNSRASGAYLGIFLLARNSGRTLTANSSWRTMAHQQALCAADQACRHGSFTWVMRPGWSNHQLGAAVDVAGPTLRGSCTAPARATSNPTWALLSRNASRFGLRQYAPESWHWEATATPCH